MNGLEIVQLISKSECLSSLFGGIFARNQMSFSLPEKDVFYICNTDFAHQKGQHWVVIYFAEKGKYIEYFDSLGKKPMEDFIRFMNQSKRVIMFNSKRVQGVKSKACGYFCLYFVFMRCQNIDFKSIMNNFSKLHPSNEKHVMEYINEMLR